MFYKVKFINNLGVYKTLIFCDKNTQLKLEESKQIDDENYEYANSVIYLDDTIENIKFKIIKSIDIDITVNEIYLFSKRTSKYTSKELYDILSQNQEMSITKAKYFNYLSNFSEIDLERLEKKDFYTYDDIIKLDIDNKRLSESFPIGIDYNLGSKYPLSITNTTVSPLVFLCCDGVIVGVGVTDGDAARAVTVTSKEKSSQVKSEGVIDGVGVGLPTNDVVGVKVGVGVIDSVGVGVNVGVAVTVEVGVTVGVEVCVGVIVGVGVEVTVTDGVFVGV